MNSAVRLGGKTAWQDAVLQKQQEMWQHVPSEWRPSEIEWRAGKAHDMVYGALSAQEKAITSATAVELLAMLNSGALTASEVVSAFTHCAVVAHCYTQCLCEINLAAARKEANYIDQCWRTDRRAGSVLHGLPISLMDRFHVAGLDSACGFASWVGAKRSHDDEGTVVRRLKRMGALILVKTNIPMSMMLGVTTNNIIGNTLNPFNPQLSAGGACGGEGALIALGGSPLGIGTDVAGSCRIPSAFCGLWAIKCSENRLPGDGVATVLPGLPVGGGAVGMLSRDMGSIEIVLRALLDSRLDHTDPDVLPIPWRQEMVDSIKSRSGVLGASQSAGGRLVIGIMRCDGSVRPHQPIGKALDLVAKALLSSGHEVVDWMPPPHSPAVEMLLKILGSTSAITARGALNASGEPPVAQIKDWYHQGHSDPRSSAEFWDLCDQKRRYCASYKSYWNRVGDNTSSGRAPDGVILPVAATLAVRPDEFHYYGYSAIANVLDYPSGVFPVTYATDDFLANLEDRREIEHLSDLDAKIQRTYRPTEIDGLPIALQVMCPRLQEETVIALLCAIRDCLTSYDAAQARTQNNTA